MVTDLAFKTKLRLPKYKKAEYAIKNVSEKDLLNIIKEFEKISRVPHEKKMTKHEPTTSYFHLVRCLAKCMMRSDEFNRHVHSSYNGKMALSLNVKVTNEEKMEENIVHETLSENQSKDASESECKIVQKTLSQNNSADVPENAITEIKDDEHNKLSVIGKVATYFNIFECGRNLLDQLDVTYQQAFMASPGREEYYTSPARERYY